MSTYKIRTWNDELPGRVQALKKEQLMIDTTEVREQLRERPNQWAAILECKTLRTLLTGVTC